MDDNFQRYLNGFNNFNESLLPEDFRFSTYFLETHNNAKAKTAGAWLKTLDSDTINDFIGVFKHLDEIPDNIQNENSQEYKTYLDLIVLSLLITEWETGKRVQNCHDDAERSHKQTEYVFRLAFLVQIDYNRRHKIENEMMQDDVKRYKGRLAIYE